MDICIDGCSRISDLERWKVRAKFWANYGLRYIGD